MIHRAYVVKLAPLLQAFPNLDIVVSLPGTALAPVGLQASYPGGPVLTPAPAVGPWPERSTGTTKCAGRSLRLPNPIGSPRPSRAPASAATCRSFRSKTAARSRWLHDPAGGAVRIDGTEPDHERASGQRDRRVRRSGVRPVIRLINAAVLYGGERVNGIYYLVSLGLAENQDEDGSNLGFAT